MFDQLLQLEQIKGGSCVLCNLFSSKLSLRGGGCWNIGFLGKPHLVRLRELTNSLGDHRLNMVDMSTFGF
jgi:hypothetical protein